MQSFCIRLSAVLLLFQCIVVTSAEEPYDPEYFLYTNWYTKNTPGENPSYRIHYDSKKPLQLNLTPFYHGAKTFLIIHGWTGNPKDEWVTNMKNALLDKEPDDANVFAVGWEKAAAGWLKYERAAANTHIVGPEVAKFLKFLNEQDARNTPDKFHVIGFSLGAQVAGFAGKSFFTTTGKKIGRISGLDPARPEFQGKGIDKRLHANDADFVDVIHTDTVSNVFPCGTPEESGTFDFWPNGGKAQPGCGPAPVKCSHYRAHQFFIESIKSSECKFRSYRSTSWDDFNLGNFAECGVNEVNCPEMGYNAINYKGLEKGNFYLSTNSGPPYCKLEPAQQPKPKHIVERPKRDTLNLEDIHGEKPHFKKMEQFDNL